MFDQMQKQHDEFRQGICGEIEPPVQATFVSQVGGSSPASITMAVCSSCGTPNPERKPKCSRCGATSFDFKEAPPPPDRAQSASFVSKTDDDPLQKTDPWTIYNQ